MSIVILYSEESLTRLHMTK